MVYLFLANGFEEMEAFTVADILRRADTEIETVSVSKDIMVTGSHNICVKADRLFENLSFDNTTAIVFPGGMPGATNLKQHIALKKLIEDLNKKNIYIAAICAAPIVLGNAGILKGKKAICYPGFESELIGAEIVDRNVVIDGNTITSKGPGTAIEFAFEILNCLGAGNKVDSLKKNMILK